VKSRIPKSKWDSRLHHLYWRWHPLTSAQRREEILKEAERGYLTVPARHRAHRWEQQRLRDIEYLIKRGLLKRVRSSSHRVHGRTYVRPTYEVKETTEPKIRMPYAKRKAGIAEFRAANPKR
jgi:hypothetical protein